MTKKILLMVVCFTMINSFLFAQTPWIIGANPGGDLPPAGGKFGTKGDRRIIFVTNNEERGTLLNGTGFWGFGTSFPNSKVHVNGVGAENPFRVQVNGASKLYVDNGGGVSVGTSAIPPANGLHVSGNTGLGTTAPTEKLHVVGNIFASANIDVGGTVGFGSVETFSDGGSFTIQSNSDIVPDADGTGNVGTTARTWASVHALSYLNIMPASAVATAENLKAGLPEIMKLRPISYTAGSVKKFGLIEKEVQSVLPEVASDKELSNSEGGSRSLKTTGKLALEYDALIPVLINGMQQQQKMIAALQEKIAQLEGAAVTAGGSDNARAGSALVSGAVLEQNQPNPFNQSTIIRYRLPQNAVGQISIYDNSGKLLKNIKANESGQATINAGDLKSGTYTYTLSVNGKLASSKKLVIAK